MIGQPRPGVTRETIERLREQFLDLASRFSENWERRRKRLEKKGKAVWPYK